MARRLSKTIYNMVQICNDMICKHLHSFFYCLYICSPAPWGIEDSQKNEKKKIKMDEREFVSYSVDRCNFYLMII